MVILLALAGAVAVSQRAALGAWAFSVTGEEAPLAQVRALWHLALSALRPPLDLRAETPMAHNGVNPFGINTFLQQEVEPAKRERQVQLIAAAGFHWLRQEFPWQDIEISGKGNFEDCRNFDPCINAWDKYDHIVGLAEQYGLEILARLSSPPSWSRAAGEAGGTFAPPDDFADFADYAGAVAERYRGRVRYFQIWNEPNIFPEWGDQPADPEAYTRLLCAAHDRLKAVAPESVVVAAPLAPTNPLGLVNGATNAAAELNDFVFLQRMYTAGAGRCFDVMSVQGYGLGSGPTDRRMRPLQFNYARNLFIRDLMVKNGDAHKALWIAEVNWNAAPEAVPSIFGRVTEAQQAQYAPLAYARAQTEWPWVGANFFWYFKRASDAEKDQAVYYFRMAEPDFTLLPVYTTMKDYIATARRMHAGWFQEDHWAVTWGAGWAATPDAAARLGGARCAAAGATAEVPFSGTELLVEFWRPGGRLSVRLDGGAPFQVAASHGPAVRAVVTGLSDGPHTAAITALGEGVCVDGFIVRRTPGLGLGLAALLAVAFGLALAAARRVERASARGPASR